MKKTLITLLLCCASIPLQAAEYKLDTQGAHAFIQFKIKHMGFSWLLGSFKKFEGHFNYNEKQPSTSNAKVSIEMKSVDSHHAERDKHLRGKDFFEVKKYPKATFVSTSFVENSKNSATLKGKLTLHGVTKNIALDVQHIGHGNDPWGGYRRGFSATTSLSLKDFNINFNLGPAAKEVELFISVEGIKQ
jgi:polyisoprenoid-binding protein YceI